MKIRWQVEDGYCGNRPHRFVIPDKALEGYEGAQLDKVIDGYVKREFEQKIGYHWEREEA